MAGGVKLSNLAAIPFSQLDDEDLFYVVDVSNGTETYVSNRISLADLRRAIISGATAGIVAKPIVYELTDNAGTPVLPQGVTYASLLEDLTEKEAIVELNYLDKVFQVSLISNLRIEFSNVDPENIFVIRITSENVVSLESFDYSSIVEEAITGATTYTDQVAATKQDTFSTSTGLNFNDNVLSADIATINNTMSGAAGKLVDANALVGSLSTAKAVDVTSTPYSNTGTITSNPNIRGTVTWTASAAGTAKIGFYDSDHAFPKFANNLVYLFIADVTSNAATTLTFGGTAVNSITGTLAANTPKRIAFLFSTATSAYIQLTATASSKLTITHLRQYEVTGCSTEARNYIAGFSNPDNFSQYYLVDYDEVNPWTYIIDMGSSPALTLASGLAYKLNAKEGSHIITVDVCPEGYYGKDTHLKLYVGDTGLVQFQAPLYLFDALTPNAVHNMTIKFRDGEATAYVDDLNSGYVVSITAGTENGTLYYGLNDSGSEYIVFSVSIDGQSITLPSDLASITVDKNLLGNGKNNSIVTLGDTKIISDAGSFNGIAFTNKNTTGDSAVYISTTGQFIDCKFQDNEVPSIKVDTVNTYATINNTLFNNNSASPIIVTNGYVDMTGSTVTSTNADIVVTSPGALYISDTTIDSNISGTGFIGISGSLSTSINTEKFVINRSGASIGINVDNAIITGGTISNGTTSNSGVIEIMSESGAGLNSILVISNTANDSVGTLAITGSTSAVTVPHAVIEVGNESNISISGSTFSANQDIMLNGSNITMNVSGTNTFVGKIYSYGQGGDITIGNNSIIDLTGNTNTVAIDPAGNITVGTGVKVINTSGTTVNVTAGTYGSINSDGTTAPIDDLYGYYVDYGTNTSAVNYIQLTDPTAEGLSRFTSKTKDQINAIKDKYLGSRACVLYSNKINKPDGKKNKVMFYLNNSDFRYKEDGTPLTADELLGRVEWNGSIRLCNFMKEYSLFYIQIYEWGDEFILSQTAAGPNTAQMFWRDSTQDSTGSYAWKYSTTTIWTASATPSVDDLTYSDNTLSTVRAVTEGNLIVRYYGKRYFSVVFSRTPREGFILHPYFWTSEDGKTAGKQYASMFKPVACFGVDTTVGGVNYKAGDIKPHTIPADIRNLANVSMGSTDIIRSIPGARPLTSTSLANFRLYASRNGTDIANAMFRSYLNMLMVFDTGNYNMQTWVAQGLAFMQAFYYFEVRNTGRTMEYGNRTCQLFADPTGDDADIENYWQGPISAGRDSSSTGAVSFARTPANDYYNSTTGVMTYGWRYTTGGVNYDIWTASGTPSANDPTYSDNTLTTVRTGLPVISYTQTAAANKCVTFSWRGLEDIYGSTWEFEEGIQKRQDATLNYKESGYLFTNAISMYTNTEIFKMTDSVDTLPITATASTLVQGTSNYAYANTQVTISKTWNPLSGTGTDTTQCWINLPWPKTGGSTGLLDSLTAYPVAAGIQTSKTGDYYYNDAAAGSRVLIVGGNARDGSHVGAFYVYVSCGLGYSNPIIACRLAASEF